MESSGKSSAFDYSDDEDCYQEMSSSPAPLSEELDPTTPLSQFMKPPSSLLTDLICMKLFAKLTHGVQSEDDVLVERAYVQWAENCLVKAKTMTNAHLYMASDTLAYSGIEFRQHLTQWVTMPIDQEQNYIRFNADFILFLCRLFELTGNPSHPAAFLKTTLSVPATCATAIKGIMDLTAGYSGTQSGEQGPQWNRYYKAMVPFFEIIISADMESASPDNIWGLTRSWFTVGICFNLEEGRLRGAEFTSRFVETQIWLVKMHFLATMKDKLSEMMSHKAAGGMSATMMRDGFVLDFNRSWKITLAGDNGSTYHYLLSCLDAAKSTLALERSPLNIDLEMA